MRKLTTEEFIINSNKVHNNFYDYSLTEYKNSKIKVKIICPKHGVFKQATNNHKKGHGCTTCAVDKIIKLKSSTTEIFIKRAQETHGNMYSYLKSKYVKNNKNLIITCLFHGDFEQRPSSHIRGNGCRKCHLNKITNKTTDFIKSAKIVHKNRYDYSKSIYVNSRKEIEIICTTHGLFLQRSDSHLKGYGCRKCTYDNISKNTEQFIEKAKKIHGNKYDYSKVDYKGSFEKVIITCRIHGDFEQLASAHKQKHGCPKCGQTFTTKYNKESPIAWSHTNWKKAGEKSKNFDSFKVYIIRCWNGDEEFYKIGKTYRTIKRRFSAKSSMPYNWEVIKTIKDNAVEVSKLEKQLQKENKQHKYIPKINFGGMNECFNKIK